MAISKCDLRDIDRFFQNKEAVFQKLFLFRQWYLSVFPPKKNIFICSGRILDNFSSFW